MLHKNMRIEWIEGDRPSVFLLIKANECDKESFSAKILGNRQFLLSSSGGFFCLSWKFISTSQAINKFIVNFCD